MNSYTAIAAKVLQQARQPLSPAQILKIAYGLRLVPDSLYGKTQFKTLHARLSEDILKNRERSQFIRTAPGRFFLRSFLSDPSVPNRYKSEWPAPLRSEQLRNFDVPCFDRDIINKIGPAFLPAGPESRQTLGEFRYRRLSSLRDDDGYFLRIFIVLIKERSILLRRSSSEFGDGFSGERSLGILGYVKRGDRTLFSTDDLGLYEAAVRTLRDQLFLTEKELRVLTENKCGDICGYVLDRQNDTVEPSIVSLVSYHLPTRFDPVEKFGLTDAYQWSALDGRVNDRDHFDQWSKLVLELNLLDELTS